MSARSIDGNRLNGELTRTQQRDLKSAHEYLINFVASLTRAIREHADGNAILERATAIRQGPLPTSSSQMRRKKKQRR